MASGVKPVSLHHVLDWPSFKSVKIRTVFSTCWTCVFTTPQLAQRFAAGSCLETLKIVSSCSQLVARFRESLMFCSLSLVELVDDLFHDSSRNPLIRDHFHCFSCLILATHPCRNLLLRFVPCILGTLWATSTIWIISSVSSAMSFSLSFLVSMDIVSLWDCGIIFASATRRDLMDKFRLGPWSWAAGRTDSNLSLRYHAKICVICPVDLRTTWVVFVHGHPQPSKRKKEKKEKRKRKWKKKEKEKEKKRKRKRKKIKETKKREKKKEKKSDAIIFFLTIAEWKQIKVWMQLRTKRAWIACTKREQRILYDRIPAQFVESVPGPKNTAEDRRWLRQDEALFRNRIKWKKKNQKRKRKIKKAKQTRGKKKKRRSKGVHPETDPKIKILQKNCQKKS